MPGISLICPVRNASAEGLTRLGNFVREFSACLAAAPLPWLDARPSEVRPGPRLAGGPTRPATLPLEVLVAAARGEDAAPEAWPSEISFLRLGVQPWTMELAIERSIRECRGKAICTIQDNQLPPSERLLEMVARLSRADFVAGRRRTSRTGKLVLGALQLPRRAILGSQRRDPDFLCWVALHEAVANLRWRPGAHRFLAELVAARGYRVAEYRVTDSAAFIAPQFKPHQAARNLLAAWKLARKTSQQSARSTPSADQGSSRKAA